MKKQGIKRQLEGTVISNKMDKTVNVQVMRLVKHQHYHKYIKRSASFAAHDDRNECQIGDKVLISETRPISKTKKWRVINILEKAV